MLQELHHLAKDDAMVRLALEHTNGGIRQIVADLADHHEAAAMLPEP